LYERFGKKQQPTKSATASSLSLNTDSHIASYLATSKTTNIPTGTTGIVIKPEKTINEVKILKRNRQVFMFYTILLLLLLTLANSS